jgi:hypothetical protein
MNPAQAALVESSSWTVAALIERRGANKVAFSAVQTAVQYKIVNRGEHPASAAFRIAS